MGVSLAAGGGWAGFWGCVRRTANVASSLSADDALFNLRTLASLDKNCCLVFSYHHSTLHFLVNSVVVCFVIFLGFRALFCLLSMLRSSGHRSDAGHAVVRRDRGKEVVVISRTESLKALSSTLSVAAKEGVLGGSVNERVALRKKSLLKWWSNLEQNEDSFSLSMVDKQDY